MLWLHSRQDNRVADALSHIPICHNHETVQSLLEGALVEAVNRGEAEASEELLDKHKHLGNETGSRLDGAHAYCGLWRSPRSGSHAGCLQKVALYSQG